MTIARDPTLKQLDDCGCCTGIGARTPVEVYNRPGLAALAYRIGTHARFKESMLARLSSRDFPALQALGTREDDDYIIALLDAWATVGDVLTFYQERIANESYLRTATEERSLYELAELIDYQPKPGVAASTHLAFTVEAAEGAPLVTTIKKGTRVQSIPGPGEKPQVFETVETIDARPEWNALRPRMTQTQALSKDMQQAFFSGLTTNLNLGDRALIVEDEAGTSWGLQRVVGVETDAEEQVTQADFVSDPLEPQRFALPRLPVAKFFTSPIKLTGTLVGNSVLGASWKQANLVALSKVQRWPLKSLVRNLKVQLSKKAPSGNTGVFAVRQQAAVFGHNAPRWGSLPASQRYGEQVIDQNGGTQNVAPVYPSDWDSSPPSLLQQSDNARYVYLDSTYKGIVPDSWVVLESASTRRLCQVEDVSDVSRSGFGMSAKVTRLKLHSNSGLNQFYVRTTTVHLPDSEPLELAELPITDDVPSGDERNSIVLSDPELNLGVGHRLILSGEREDLEGVTESELVTIADVTISGGYTQLSFSKALEQTYKRNTVTLNANVALATHGEHKTEVLGSGDGGVAFQSFKLRQPPLTYVAAATSSGAEATLEVRVDGLKWQEAPSLYGCGPDDRIYVLRTDTEGDSRVQFGDGRTGARLPTGLENVQATYRRGMGEEGMVDSGQLSLLLNRPLGVKSVDNPIAAAGAQDREARDQVRSNASLAIMTLDRIVSLQDYEDFARSFAGIAKALASWTWEGQGRGVFVTVAGPNGAEVKPGQSAYSNLVQAMREAGDPLVELRVKSYRPALFRVEGRLKIDPAYESAVVRSEVENALRKQFGFSSRRFGQGVTRSEVYSVMQRVSGVIATDLDYLYRTDKTDPDEPPALESSLTAAIPEAGAEAPLAAELLTLDPRPVPLGIMS